MEEQKIESVGEIKPAEEKIIEDRTRKIFSFIKQKYNWISYLILAFLVWLAVWLRSLPMKINSSGHPGLWDISTNNWTLGPDLDPFLFLRWAKDIVTHGSLMVMDTLRYVPRGYDVSGELTPHVYLIAYFHDILVRLGLTSSVEYSAIIYPVFVFALTVIVFFLLSRKVVVDSVGVKKANAIGLISSFFLIVIPALLPRTIAGIPEKESSGFFLLFLALYLFLCAWKAKSLKYQIALSALSGLATTLMAGVWGGWIYIPLTLSICILFSFVLGQLDRNKMYVALTWLTVSYLAIKIAFSNRYSLLGSTTTLIPLAIAYIIVLNIIIFNTSLKRYFEGNKLSKIPRPAISIIVGIIIGLIVILIMPGFGPGYLLNKFSDITKPLITPITDRLGVSVAENRQPYFGEWADSFGPVIGNNIPLFFWLFFIGSIYLYSYLMKSLSKSERLILTASYAIFLFAMVFSRYSSTSTFNGTNFISIAFYLIGVLCLLSAFGYYYYRYFKNNNLDVFKHMDFGLIMLFSFFFLSLVSARGAVRLIMVLVPSVSIIVAFLVVSLVAYALKVKDSSSKTFAWLLVILICLSTAYSGYQFYLESKSTAEGYIPNSYTQQWQLAMGWVRENTSTNAVFAHWWDYGYWVQTMGQRATVLDGGNAIPYWDYLMGRYALTSSNNTEALNFLYSHNTTHFLIDSSDIGKYAAFSSIGSNENYDRASYIPEFRRNDQQTQENKNSTTFLYQGGAALDDDIMYTENGTKLFLPAGTAGLAGIIIEQDSSRKIISQPIGVFVYHGQQYKIPFRYAFSAGNLTDFGSGLESGVFRMSELVQSSQGFQINQDGMLLYLSARTVRSQLARLYLYKENNPNFKLVHSEDDFVVKQLKSENALGGDDFVYYGGVRGPIRIWEISYPRGMKVNPVFLQTNYPDVNLTVAK